MSPTSQMKIAIVGQFSSGKSALINALLRKHIVPMGVEPKTATLHRITWHEKELCQLLRQDGSKESVDFTVLEELTGDTEKTRTLEAIKIGLPESFLKDVELWDTPGFGSLNLSHEIAARKALADADLALWVTPIDSAITKEEKEKLARLKHYETPVILVINKADLADEDELEEAVDDIAKNAGDWINQVIWTSCKIALNEKDKVGGRRPKESGFERLDEVILDAVLQWRQEQKKKEEARQSLVGLSANDIRCDGCGAVCRHDDRFCECGANLAKYHKVCPRCDTDNVVRRTRCRGCNLVFMDYEQGLDFFNRAQEELALGMMMEALASLQVALSYDPMNESYQDECGRLEKNIEQIEALLREGSRVTQSKTAVREWSTARQLVKSSVTSMQYIDQRLKVLCLQWSRQALQRALRDAESTEGLYHAVEGFAVIEWVRDFVSVGSELAEVSRQLRKLNDKYHQLQAQKIEALRIQKEKERALKRLEEERRRAEERRKQIEENNRLILEEERRRAEERRKQIEENNRLIQEKQRLLELREKKNYQFSVTAKIGTWVWKRKITGICKMIYCPPGEFWMGSKGGVGEDCERPRHKVRLTQGYWMGQTQVTQALWEAVMGSNPSHFKGETLPVESVNWFDCVMFCNVLSQLEGLDLVYEIGGGDQPNVKWNRGANGYRLPTEAEWERAAKAGTDLKYSGSDNIDEVAWYGTYFGGTVKDNKTQPVAQKKANAWGFYDMSGNVWEWCNEQWDSKTYQSYKQNPTGLVENPYRYGTPPASRSYRGGVWGSAPVYCRVAYRCRSVPSYRGYDLGLRLLRVDA